jgi:hypothetical protein
MVGITLAPSATHFSAMARPIPFLSAKSRSGLWNHIWERHRCSLFFGSMAVPSIEQPCFTDSPLLLLISV